MKHLHLLLASISGEWEFPSDDFGESLSGWWLLWRRIRSCWSKDQGSIPSMAEISTRLAFISAERQLEDTMRKHCDLYVILRDTTAVRVILKVILQLYELY